MTQNDIDRINEASRTKYYHYGYVHALYKEAESEEARAKLRDIRDILYDMYLDRGRYDPTQEENMQGLRRRALSVLRRTLRPMLAKK